MSAMVQSGEAGAMAAGDAKLELVWATCACCGLREECTPGYIAQVRERYSGRWVCGLCGEAVKDEIRRSRRQISTEEALSRHTSFSESFRSSAPPIDTAKHLIAAVRQVLRRSLESSSLMRSAPNGPHREEVAASPVASDVAHHSFARSESCFSSLYSGSLAL